MPACGWSGACAASAWSPSRRQPATRRCSATACAAARLVHETSFAELGALLADLPGPWAGELAEAVLARIRKAGKDDWQLGRVCRVAALRLAPDLYPKAGELLPRLPRTVGDHLATTLG